MKKNSLFGVYMLSILACVGASSCSSSDETAGNDAANGKAISIKTSIGNGVESRVTYTDDETSKVVTVNWSTAETFKMYQGTGGSGTEFSKSAEGNVFTGTAPTDGSGNTYYGVYPATLTNANGALSIDISSQVGTTAENGIKEFMVAQTQDLTQTLTFAHKLVVLKLSLTLPAGVTGTASEVTVSGLHSKATYSLSGSNFTYADWADIVAKNGTEGFAISSNKITAYVAVFPQDVSAHDVTITAKVGDNYYAYTMAAAKNLSQVVGKVVPVSVSLTAVKNFKSAYTSYNYYQWDAVHPIAGTFTLPNITGSATHSCKNAPSIYDIAKYLGAGVYWDDGSDGDNQQTYSVNGVEYHTGLWMMKKQYIPTSTQPVESVSFSSESTGRPGNISHYFFLPAAGYYNINTGTFSDASTGGYYWSSTVTENSDPAYCLKFDKETASCLYELNLNNGCLPLVAE